MIALITTTSLVSGEGFKVQINPYAPNPLADDYEQVNPATYATAVAKAGPPPKMFDGGMSDLPPFTASGVDPQVLLRLPFTARHAAAAVPDRSTLLRWLDEGAENADLYLDHPGLRAAIVRMRNWASGRMDFEAMA